MRDPHQPIQLLDCPSKTPLQDFDAACRVRELDRELLVLHAQRLLGVCDLTLDTVARIALLVERL